MIVNITHRSSKVSDKTRARIEDWLSASASRFENITSASIILNKVKGEDCAEASVHVAGKDIFAKATGSNLYAALDSLETKIDRQLGRLHQKHMSRKNIVPLELAPESDLIDGIDASFLDPDNASMDSPFATP